MEGIVTLLMRMTQDDSLNKRMKQEVVLEVKDIYIEEREDFLKSVDPKLVESTRRDKDMLFQMMASNYLLDEKYIYTRIVNQHQDADVRMLTEMMHDVVFRAEPQEVQLGWIWSEDNVSSTEVNYETE